ncbi:nuclear transport factor 2 family protein [Hugenholtzia roseola]|uniref:nuclear transport factor 2 family protein n=1 Tax=Hugenholtzia roseola TaxID=1002 RepID=UPI000414BAD7|nr:nuclear transport factor 2 family protein [Hugenholtzia roseola]
MTTQETANKLIELCRYGKFEEAQKSLYAQDAVSIEPEHTENNVVKGLDAIIKKGDYFRNSADFHSVEVSDALVSGNFFTLSMGIDLTWKHNQQRTKMEEIAVFEVKEGKIIKEQFFF